MLPTETFSDKVTIRCTASQRRAVAELVRRGRDKKEAQILRTLLSAALSIAERRGISALEAIIEGRDLPPVGRTEIPVFKVLPEPPSKVGEGPLTLDPETAVDFAPVPPNRYPTHAVALLVADDDMIRAGYGNGAKAVVDCNRAPRDGDLVAVARLGHTLLRRYRRKAGRIILSTEGEFDETFTPRSALDIRGVVLGQIES